VLLEDLLLMAREASRRAYAPYSGIRVGAAVLTEKGAFPGANVENASYGLTVCAERVAVFKAIYAGAREIRAVAVYSDDVFPLPCGACLQVISEFGSPETTILVAGRGLSRTFTLRELLPHPFPGEGPDQEAQEEQGDGVDGGREEEG